jgi:LysR family glycine cleavage system transcriptional activator
MSLARRYLPSLSSLRALEAVDRLGTATAAASELALTQSAVSRQLQHLEARLGAALMIREKRRIRMTPAGKTYAAEIRTALGQITRASMQVHTGAGAGGLSLAILPSFGMRWLVPRLAQFALLHPDVTVNLSSRLTQVNFENETFDAAIQYGNGTWPGSQSLLLREETMMAVCAPSLLDAAPLTSPGAVARHPLLHIATRPQAWSHWLKTQGAEPPATAGTLFDQFSTITQAAIHGLGIALLPDFIADGEIASGRLIPAYGPALKSSDAYYLVWPDHKSTDTALQIFRDWIATQSEDEDNLPR